MTQQPPALTQLELPHLWREFNPSPNPRTFRHIQKPPAGSDPAINVVLDRANRNRAGWVHPWTRQWLMRHGVRVLAVSFIAGWLSAVSP